ncbi:hypothetical protein QU487_21665 [Crenobacter sp. SG2305]|uniref:hypothetical protein n=1 Tax=Crenobacter oryzisoli TaxID=3056844 RepID=UPI0025AB39F2|nr:hypothetical protein [Crenobacter sp. SG2305]MDN0085312.1 hypothetical protein [Crenobacter sp. SG2305]
MTIAAPILISLLAFTVSVASLTISLLNYLRDRSKLKVWSEICWQHNGPEPEIPHLHIRIANMGRRPTVVLNLVKRDGKAKWWRPIPPPILDEAITGVAQFDDLRRKSLAHLVSAKLAEGEILEIVFRPEDCHEFVSVREDAIFEAKTLQVEDAFGKLYSVKNSEKNILLLMKAWQP